MKRKIRKFLAHKDATEIDNNFLQETFLNAKEILLLHVTNDNDTNPTLSDTFTSEISEKFIFELQDRFFEVLSSLLEILYGQEKESSEWSHDVHGFLLNTFIKSLIEDHFLDSSRDNYFHDMETLSCHENVQPSQLKESKIQNIESLNGCRIDYENVTWEALDHYIAENSEFVKDDGKQPYWHGLREILNGVSTKHKDVNEAEVIPMGDTLKDQVNDSPIDRTPKKDSTSLQPKFDEKVKKIRARQARVVRNLLCRLSSNGHVSVFTSIIFHNCINTLQGLQSQFELFKTGSSVATVDLLALESSGWLLQVYETAAINLGTILQKEETSESFKDIVFGLFRQHFELYRKIDNLDETYFAGYISCLVRITAFLLSYLGRD